MTCREKLALDYPKDNIEKIISTSCPDQYDYILSDTGCIPGSDCEKCWDREVEEKPLATKKDIEEDAILVWKNKYADLYDEYQDCLENERHWMNEAEARGEVNYNLKNDIRVYKAVIRTVELLLGGKILDD